jgi:hypothetical protein
MPLPDLTPDGELPLGVHPTSLRDLLARFGGGLPQRIAVAERLERIYHLAAATGHLGRFIVFGSFVTDEPEPNDVDVFLVMDDDFDGESLVDEAAVLFDHSAAHGHFGASVFWVRRLATLGSEQSMVEYWQAKRGGGKRGIVEIVGESDD